MTHLKLQVGDLTDGTSGGAFLWATCNLSTEEFKELTDNQVIEFHLMPALQQLVREARHLLDHPSTITARIT